jgi:hypothetical protein
MAAPRTAAECPPNIREAVAAAAAGCTSRARAEAGMESRARLEAVVTAPHAHPHAHTVYTRAQRERGGRKGWEWEEAGG